MPLKVVEDKDTRPLHVKTAEALGWKELEPAGHEPGRWYGLAPDDVLHTGYEEEDLLLTAGTRVRVPLFDMWWSSTGPLIDAYDIQLIPLQKGNGYQALFRVPGDLSVRFGAGGTRLKAVCALLVYLAKAGKSVPVTTHEEAPGKILRPS